MTQLPSQGPVVWVKPQSTVYTILLAVAILILAVTIGLALYKLMADVPNGYGLSLGDLFKPSEIPGTGK
ncbi:MAG: hypothetical protein KAU28_01755 [Phycisphaerae bacterium]|nr:hypothetical protein [Phycisphaerae bacterium]